MIFTEILNNLSTAVAASSAGGSFFGFDLPQILQTIGYAGIVAVIFAESGLLIGFFLPGDTLLFTAGVLSSAAAGKLLNTSDSQGIFNIVILLVLCIIAAITGDSTGYWFGAKVGPHIFTKEDSLFFQKKHILRAQHFYEKHGGKTIILARFLPVVRTFAPIVAGVGKMRYTSFLAFNVIGGAGWVTAMLLAGFFLGQSIPADQVDKFVLPVVVLIFVLSVAPTAWHILKEQENREAIMRNLRNLRNRKQPVTPTLTTEKVVKPQEK